MEMLKLAEEKSIDVVKANIYSFNSQSQKMFLSIGFQKVADEWFEYRILPDFKTTIAELEKKQ